MTYKRKRGRIVYRSEQKTVIASSEGIRSVWMNRILSTDAWAGRQATQCRFGAEGRKLSGTMLACEAKKDALPRLFPRFSMPGPGSRALSAKDHYVGTGVGRACKWFCWRCRALSLHCFVSGRVVHPKRAEGRDSRHCIRPPRTGSAARPFRNGAGQCGPGGVILKCARARGCPSRRVPHKHRLQRSIAGANRWPLTCLMLGQGMKNAVPSIGAGLLLAFLGSRFIADLLYDVSPHDPLVFLSVAGSVLVIAVTARLVPAWRACRIARHARFMVSFQKIRFDNCATILAHEGWENC